MSEHQPSSGDFNREDQPATTHVLAVFVTEYACALCTPVERAAYGDHCPHSAKRASEQAKAREALREYARRYYVVIDLSQCTECGDVA